MKWEAIGVFLDRCDMTYSVKKNGSILNFLKFGKITVVESTTGHSIWHKKCDINSKEFMETPQFPEVIVIGMTDLGYMILRGVSELKVTPRFFAFTAYEIKL